jgi:hypothetical protein
MKEKKPYSKTNNKNYNNYPNHPLNHSSRPNLNANKAELTTCQPRDTLWYNKKTMRDEREETHSVKSLKSKSITKILVVVLVIAALTGIGTGYVVAQNNKGSAPSKLIDIGTSKPKTASQDNRTFRDFAEGKITARPASKDPEEYAEGTHLLVRDGAMPVALTSSVVDLSEYENKTVKVYGETQKALKEGWLMDVGRVEEK